MIKEYIYYENLSHSQIELVKNFNNNSEINYEIIICEICNSKDFKTLFNNDRYGINQKTCYCNQCGFVFSNPRMSKESASIFYNSDTYRLLYSDDKSFTDDGKTFTKEMLYKSTLEKLRQHQPSLPKKPNFQEYYEKLYFDFINNEINNYETVLDIGTGKGEKLIDFGFIGKKVEGIEPSKTYNKVHLELGLNSRVGLLEDINKQYDLVLLTHVFEHLTNLDEVVNKLSNITKRYLFIEVPGHVVNLQSIQNAHNYYFSLNTINYFILKNKFKLIKIDYARNNEFIFALYEKTKKNSKYDFNYNLEKKIIKSIHRKYLIKYFLIKLLKLSKTEKIVRFFYNRLKKIN